LKVDKGIKSIRLFLKQVNPSKFTIIIDKAYIIIMTTNKSRCMTPYIREN
jgi:hypothetical protein